MKSVKGLSILVTALLLQGCLPDSFTKFKEEPAVQAEGGTSSGGNVDDVCSNNLGDPFCVQPTTMEYSPNSFTFDINRVNLSAAPQSIEPNIRPIEDLDQYMTFTIQPPLPSETGLSFDVETGIISGVPSTFYPRTEHVVTGQYEGSTSTSVTSSNKVVIEIATTLDNLLTIKNPTDQTVVLKVGDTSSFNEGHYVAANKDNGLAKITYVDEKTNELHLDTSDIGSDGRFILRTENQLSLDNSTDKTGFINEKTKSVISTIALKREDDPSIKYENVLSLYEVQVTGPETKAVSALKFAPLGLDNTIQENEMNSITYDITPSISPYGLNFAKSNSCHEIAPDPSVTPDTRKGIDIGPHSDLRVHLQASGSLPNFAVGDSVTTSNGVQGVINSVNATNSLIQVSTLTTSRILELTHLSKGTSFDPMNSSFVSKVEDFCDLGDPNYVQIPGGTIWGEVDSTKSLTPTTFRITANNLNKNSTSVREFNLSILNPPAPKSIDSVAYRQQEGVKLKLYVDDANPFELGDTISNSQGKTADVIGRDLASREVFVQVNNKGDNTVTLEGESIAKDDLIFDHRDGIDNSQSFFSSKASITDTPTFLYTNEPINNIEQPFLKNIITPSLFEQDASIAETRSLAFEITPNIELLGNSGSLKFQGQSGCYDISTNPNDISTWVEQLDGNLNPDFTNCDPLSPNPNYLEIRGGTIWGEFDQGQLPLAETSFEVTAQTLTGIEKTASFKMEVTPAIEPPELSYTQDFLLKVQDTSNFEVGDFFSNSGGSYGEVKQVINVDSSNRYLWVKLIDGSAELSDNQPIDNKKRYKNLRGYVIDVHPVNAILTTTQNSGTGISGIPDIVNDDDENSNIITNGSGARARLVYQNQDKLYVRVTQGIFTTGNTLYEEDGVTPLSEQITNINAQNLTLNIQNVVNGTLPPDFDMTDTDIVYASDATGTTYTGVAAIRSKSGTTIDIEMTKGRLGDIDFEATRQLYFDNPHDGSSAHAEIESISTNSQRYSFYKERPVYILPNVEPNSSVHTYEITPDLPEGINLDANTGIISGTPTDRSDFIQYKVTASGFQQKEYSFELEVKDYIGLVDQSLSSSTYILHKDGMGNGRTPCAITRDQWRQDNNKNRDIGCYLEAGEKELYSGGIDLDLVFGEDMCQFVRHHPYHIAVRSAGLTTNAQANPSLPTIAQEVHVGDIEACSADGADEDLTLEALQNECQYDHSSESEFESYNCDEGFFDYEETSYVQEQACDCTSISGCTEHDEPYDANTCGSCDGGGGTKTACTGTWDPGSEVAKCFTTQETKQYECGGSIPACIEGAGTDMFSKSELFELVTVQEENVQPLDKVSYSYTSPINKNFKSNRHLANFLQVSSEPTCTEGDYKLNYTEIEKTMSKRLVKAIEDDEIGSALTGRPFYTYECADGTGEIIARIRLMVRDWDKPFRASSEIDKVDPNTGNIMDDTGYDSFGYHSNEFVDHQPSSLGGTCGPTGSLDIQDDLGNSAWPHEIDANLLPCITNRCFF